MALDLGNWLTTEQATELTGYHRDHLTRLARDPDGDVKVEKIGTSWLYDKQSLLDHQANAKPGPATGTRRGGKNVTIPRERYEQLLLKAGETAS